MEPVQKAHQTNTAIVPGTIQIYGVTSTVPVTPIRHPSPEPSVYHKVAVQRPSCPKRRLYQRIFKRFCSRPTSEDAMTRRLDARKSASVKDMIGVCIVITLLWLWILEAQDAALGDWFSMMMGRGHNVRPLVKALKRLRQDGKTSSKFSILLRQPAHSSTSV